MGLSPEGPNFVRILDNAFSDLCTTPRDRIIASSLANFMNGSMKALFKCATKSAPTGDDSILTHMCEYVNRHT